MYPRDALPTPDLFGARVRSAGVHPRRPAAQSAQIGTSGNPICQHMVTASSQLIAVSDREDSGSVMLCDLLRSSIVL